MNGKKLFTVRRRAPQGDSSREATGMRPLYRYFLALAAICMLLAGAPAAHATELRKNLL